MAAGLVLIGSAAAFADTSDPSDTTAIDTTQAGTYEEITTGTTSDPGYVAPKLASPDYAVPPTWHNTYALNDKATTYSYTNKNQVLGVCYAGTAMNCTITKSTTAERTIQLGVTATWTVVSDMLNISDAHSVTMSVACSAETPAGHYLYAYPLGTRYDYTIHHHRYYTIAGSTHHYGIFDEYAYGRSAFSPGANRISCRVV